MLAASKQRAGKGAAGSGRERAIEERAPIALASVQNLVPSSYGIKDHIQDQVNA
jgi:hypothetical protein